MRERAAAKATRYLSEGRVIIDEVGPSRVLATIRGDGAVHRAIWDAAGGWRCTCPSPSTGCSHLRAVRLVVAVDLPTPPRGQHR